MRVGLIIHFGVEIPIPFKPLQQVALPFLPEVRIDRAFLITGMSFFRSLWRTSPRSPSPALAGLR